jgi:hypothetical protein
MFSKYSFYCLPTIAVEMLKLRYSYVNFPTYTTVSCGPGSSVGIATGHELEGPGNESRFGRDFPHLSRLALGHTQPPVKWKPWVSRG